MRRAQLGLIVTSTPKAAAAKPAAAATRLTALYTANVPPAANRKPMTPGEAGGVSTRSTRPAARYSASATGNGRLAPNESRRSGSVLGTS
jgi:hypothetical protein